MATLEERLNLAESIIKKPAFRENKGLGNEIGYYIFDYMPQKEVAVRQWIGYIKNKYCSGIDGFRIQEFDIYDIMINILEEKGYLEKCFDFEEKHGLDRIMKAVSSALRITSTESPIVRHIREHTNENAVIFLTGIGKSYPIIRSHSILNNLHQVIDDVPVVMFYPGRYSGQDLLLFGEIKDDNYYRAFKLVS